jgi:exodeoxyribonuclease VII small subunit
MSAKKAPTFEEALAELEQTIDKLEGSELTLDTALAYFEKGVGLIRICDEQLKRADGKLKELLKGENGEFIERVIGVNLSSVLGGEDLDA